MTSPNNLFLLVTVRNGSVLLCHSVHVISSQLSREKLLTLKWANDSFFNERLRLTSAFIMQIYMEVEQFGL